VIWDWLQKLDATQRSRWFKIAASCVVVGACLVGLIAYSVQAARARDAALSGLRSDGPASAGQASAGQASTARAPAQPASDSQETASKDALAPEARERPDDALDATRRVFEGMVASQYATTGVAAALGMGALVTLAIIWLGLGLTYLGLALACGCALAAAHLFGVARLAAPPLVGLVVLLATFTSLMRLLTLALSGSHPVLSIARNVLTEAVRMRVSLIFILLSMFALAALPLLMQDEQPLRYRVQAFLQYATSSAFLIIALLVVVFSVATVAIEQREKIIWQTATKPVAAWQYVLGKWLGMAALSLALLGVCAIGIFLFTEHLRRQPAIGEVTAFQPRDDAVLTEDRMLLETQVLTARRSVRFTPPEVNSEEFERDVQAYIENELRSRTDLGTTPEEVLRAQDEVRDRVRESLLASVADSFRTIEPASVAQFRFEGLSGARDASTPLVLRYKVNAGSNMPDALYRLTFEFPTRQAARVVEVPLAQMLTMQLMPGVIDDDGSVTLNILNADAFQGLMNRDSITFPPDGLELTYSVGSFHANYLRLMLVLWVKLLFLAMLGVASATFLSFPVATLVSITTFLAAEGARFLLTALDSYHTEDAQGNILWFNTAIAKFANLIGNALSVYADLRPTARLVDGEHLAWSTLAGGGLVLLLWSAILFAIGVLIFRKRELAMYSGH
jgi:ABC-type transport system involved in multi-copper enzyme maturation permease subunit